MSRRRRAAAGIGLVALVATGCGSSHHHTALPPPTTSSTSSTSTSTSTVPATTTTVPADKAPLTGLTQPNAAQLVAPAVVVKIDNVDPARPQTGVNQADLVYEEMVEGGLTRLAAVFQSDYPTTVGPVRSGRLTDIAIVDDLNHPVLAFAGSNGVFLPILRAQPIDDVDIDNRPSLFWRGGRNYAPHNVYTNLVADAATDPPSSTPPAVFTYRAAGTPLTAPGVGPAKQISLRWPAAGVVWTYDAAQGVWARTQDGTADVDTAGVQITATNLIIQPVTYITSLEGVESGVATAIPEGLLVGSGPCWVVSGGQIVQGTWTRAADDTVTTYSDSAGNPIALAPGRTWVELTERGTTPSVS